MLKIPRKYRMAKNKDMIKKMSNFLPFYIRYKLKNAYKCFTLYIEWQKIKNMLNKIPIFCHSVNTPPNLFLAFLPFSKNFI